MEALETSINYWEDALAAFSVGARGGVTGTLALTSPEEAEFCREIQDLLQNAYLLQVGAALRVLFTGMYINYAGRVLGNLYLPVYMPIPFAVIRVIS